MPLYSHKLWKHRWRTRQQADAEQREQHLHFKPKVIIKYINANLAPVFCGERPRRIQHTNINVEVL